MKTSFKTVFVCTIYAIMASAMMPTAQAQSVPQQEFLPHPADPEQRIEVYWATPQGDGPWPAILYVHGHQFGERPGARFYVDREILQRTTERGLVAAAVSQPGYGRSGGSPDYCDPRSQQAVEAALTFLRRHPQVQKSKVILYGYSRGAIVASVVATRDSALAGLILGAGAYDIAEQYAQSKDAGLKHNIEREAGTSPAAFRERSALFDAHKIRASTLILHGEDDTTCPTKQAVRLAEVLRVVGTPVRLEIFPGTGHHIPREDRAPVIDAFIEETIHR